MHSYLSKIIFIFLLVLTMNVSSKDLHYAGFFLMSHQDVKKELPYSFDSIYSSEEKYQAFSKVIESLIEKTNNPHYTISKNLGKINKGDALAFGLALTGESIDTYKVQSTKVANDIYLKFNILVFDFKDRVLIFNMPFTFTINQYGSLDKNQITDLIYDSLINKNTNEVSFESILKENISKIPDNFQPLRVGINKVEIDPEINLPKDLSAEIFKIQSAQRFEAKISENSGVPLIPYSIGSIKDRKLGLLSKFSDQADFFLKMPEPDIAFNLTVKPFKSLQKNVDEFRLRKSIVAKAKIELVEPYTNESYFSGNIHSIRTFKLNVDNESEFAGENLWVMYIRLQNYLFHSFSKQLNSPDDKLKEITKDIDASMLNKLLSEIKQ